MVDWRELGEVPDSEDEDNFDSQDLEQLPPLLVAADAHNNRSEYLEKKHTEKAKDTWDIPSSQEDQPNPLPPRKDITAAPVTNTPSKGHDTPISSPLSPPGSISDHPPIEHILSSPQDGEKRPFSLLSSPNSSSPPINDDNVSGTGVRIITPDLDFTSHLDPIASAAQNDVQSPQGFAQSQLLGEDGEQQAARRVALQYERSLRARRPEQLRPYFTEMTRFNHEWRRHGLRPVRIENENRPGPPLDQRPPSAERDFDPESQDSGLPGVTDDSQHHGQNPFWDEAMDNFMSSSPVRPSPATRVAAQSSQTDSHGDTDNTSVNGDELPSLEDLARRRFSRTRTKRAGKRKSSPTLSSRKRSKPIDYDDKSSDPTPRFIIPPDSPKPLYSNPTNLLEDTSHASGASISPHNREDAVGDNLISTPSLSPMVIDDDLSTISPARQVRKVIEDDQSTESDSAASGSEIVNRNGRRIKGVLPASWLRLDRQSDQQKLQKRMNRNNQHRSPEREQRRGVAQPRQSLQKSATMDLFLESDESDEASVHQKTTDEVFHNQTMLFLEPTTMPIGLNHDLSDGNTSAMEDNEIDRMMPAAARKRQLGLKDSFSRQHKVAKPSSSRRPPSTKTSRQPKITKTFSKSNSSVSASKPLTNRRSTISETQSRARKTGSGVKMSSRHSRPPQLSILDVIEPQAPQFLKIAARAARRKHNQGRASPSKKSIHLGTRVDHIDVTNVLRDWRRGSINQRSSVSAARKAKRIQPQPRQPLTDRSVNSTASTGMSLHQLQTAPRKLTKRVGSIGNTTFKSNNSSDETKEDLPRTSNDAQRRAAFTKPAQLEVDDRVEMGPAAFHFKKKMLDRLYRKKFGRSSVAPSINSVSQSGLSSPQPVVSKELQKPSMQNQQVDIAVQNRQRRRKIRQPQWVDVDAAQYSRANDPVPEVYASVQIQETTQRLGNRPKLEGLGPYGTQYTRHFEIFPLDRRVYFHESTLIGSGALEALSSDSYCERLKDTRPRHSLPLGEQTLRWGSWSSQVSSELGIVLDFMADRLDGLPVAEASNMPNLVDAAHFLFIYMKDSLSFPLETDAKSFVCRILEVLRAFNDRVVSRLGTFSTGQIPLIENALQVYDRMLLVAMFSLKICADDQSMATDRHQMDELLKSISRTIMRMLIILGFDTVRSVYADLNSVQFRERGLRDNAPAIHSWVLTLKSLETAQILRASFWDLLHEVMAPATLATVTDASELEHLWENLFTLLPLTEFNLAGVIVQGQRHGSLSEGWKLPQQLLRRVFQIYQDNPRQSPSFNSYCRALVGRCHYLVQQWGWLKCSGIVGVIFDFFGSRNLAHLRNEEFYKSPRFLENLALRPSLDIEPEDRCFHIFLKLLALNILKLKEKGLKKDIRNLVARTTPNHNRQYLNDQNIHERDLAALRNHHDLLCTLFWAAPPDLRPAVSHIGKLVVPETSHKEACLISCRAWSQLARYVIASGDSARFMKDFSLWRNAFFKQVLQQFDSVATDIRQQLSSLSTDASKSIDQSMVDAMVKANKSAIMDVLHLSMSASLEVIKQAPDLEAATYALSTVQLQTVFTHFTAPRPELDWTILRTALATLGTLLDKVDEYKGSEESQQSESQILHSAVADDVLLTIQRDVAASYFSMARCMLSSHSSQRDNFIAELERTDCLEMAVTLAARLGMRFIDLRLMGLSDMFKRSKFGIFDDRPHKLGLEHRRYLSLFITSLLKHGFDDFSGAGFTLSELWALSIVKPKTSLAFENKLAEQLIRHGKDFVPEAVVGLSIKPDYNTNRDLFEFAISTMRKSTRDAGARQKKEYSTTLKVVMEQIKSDLRTVSSDTLEHSSYVCFVREIVSLIRTHGFDLCKVDDFFYQISRDYSPPVQDPQLQVAGMTSYGLRLTEGDSKVVLQLFYFLFNNFKLAMMNNKIEEEVGMLRRGMENPGVLGFVLGKMIPAMVRASLDESSVFPLVDVYAQACHSLLADGVAPHELTEGDLVHLIGTFDALASVMGRMRSNRELTAQQLHLTRHFVGLLNLAWPSLCILDASKLDSDAWKETKDFIGRFRGFFVEAEEYLEGIMEMGYELVDACVLFRVLQRYEGDAQIDQHIKSFRENMIRDVRQNWVMAGEKLTIQAPSKARSTQSTQSGQGIELPHWDTAELIRDLWLRCREWNRWWEKVFGGVLQPMRFTDMNMGIF
jgi:hypothetical protein